MFYNLTIVIQVVQGDQKGYFRFKLGSQEVCLYIFRIVAVLWLEELMGKFETKDIAIERQANNKQ